jgi:hypothetical protein
MSNPNEPYDPYNQGKADAPGLIAMLWALVPGASNDRDYDDYEEKGDEHIRTD